MAACAAKLYGESARLALEGLAVCRFGWRGLGCVGQKASVRIGAIGTIRAGSFGFE